MKLLTHARLLFGILFLGSAGPLSAAAEAWLPGNTLGVVRVPNTAAARIQWAENPWHQLWRDPAMQPFRERFMAQLGRDQLDSRREQPGLSLTEAIGLAQGELVLALVPPMRNQFTLDRIQFLLLIDVGDQAAGARQQLRPPVAEPNAQNETGSDGTASPVGLEATITPEQPTSEVLEPKILDPSERTATDSEDDTAFTIGKVGFYPANVRWPPSLLSGPEAGTSPASPCWAGLSGSWLLVGSDTNHLAAVLRHMQDGTTEGPLAAPASPVATVGSQPDTGLYGWLDLRPMLGALLALADTADRRRDPADEVPMPKWRDMLEGSGLTGLRSVALTAQDSSAGTRIEVQFAAPAASRRGLLEVFALEPLDASPPPDVAANVARFERIRLDFNQGWRTFEAMMIDLFPQLTSVLDLLFQAVGPGGERGDLRDALLPVLGNDIISCELAPRTASLTSMLNPPSLIRMRSINPPQLALSLKALTVLLPPPLNDLGEEQIAGYDVFSIPLPRFSWLGTSANTVRPVKFTALESDVVFTSDRALLESLLTPNTPPQPALRDRADLIAAAPQVGGTDQGLFGFHDLAQSMRTTFALLRQEPNAIQRLLERSPIAPPPQSPVGRFLQGLDPTLLPPFDQVVHLFPIMVHAAGTDPERYYYRLFMPRPPR